MTSQNRSHLEYLIPTDIFFCTQIWWEKNLSSSNSILSVLFNETLELAYFFVLPCVRGCLIFFGSPCMWAVDDGVGIVFRTHTFLKGCCRRLQHLAASSSFRCKHAELPTWLTYSFDRMTFIWPCDLSHICSCLPTSCGSLCCGTRFLEMLGSMLGSKNYFTFLSIGFCLLVCDYTTRLRKSGFMCIYFLYYSLPGQFVHLLEIYIVSYCIPKSIIFLV